jgi:hypothetical protein
MLDSLDEFEFKLKMTFCAGIPKCHSANVFRNESVGATILRRPRKEIKLPFWQTDQDDPTNPIKFIRQNFHSNNQRPV